MSFRVVIVAGAMAFWGFGSASGEEKQLDLRFLRPLDLAGKDHRLSDNEKRLGSVFVFLSPECAISKQYIPELNRLSKLVPSEKVAFFGVISDGTLKRADAAGFQKEFNISFPVLFDGSGELAELFQPTHVPEAFVLDPQGQVAYRGRIDDVYVTIDKRRAEPRERNLKDASTALADGKTVAVKHAAPVGCLFESLPGKKSSSEVTFTRHIAPLLYANCTECHRQGEVGPFALMTYEDAAKRASFLSDVTDSRLMPPWRAEIGHGDFNDERRLTDKQVAILKRWAEAGAPKGDDADMPPSPQFPEGWRLGTPDVVLEAPVPFTVPADGPDIFQHFVIPIEIPEDKTLVGFEFRAGNRAVVHHAVLFMDATGKTREKDAETPEPGYRTFGSVEASISAMIGVWTPGMTPALYPEGIGIRIPKKSDLVLQLHLHPTGKEEVDLSKVGLYFADKPIQDMKMQNVFLLGSLMIDIPPGENNYRVSSTFTLPIDLTFVSIFPHLHLIGKDMKITATLPDGKTKSLIWIKDWNFYWQDNYVYKQPLTLPKGTRLDVEAHYDNSANNPFNPSSPPKPVYFGNGSGDEMCFAIFQVVGENRETMRQLGPSLMKTFVEDWNRADISDVARDRIIDEAGKLFGGGRRSNLVSLLLSRRPQKTGNATPANNTPQ
ncbi:MAG: redoxin domain-containing protein [Planctomycetota bacterium]